MSTIVWEAATVIGHIYERKELKVLKIIVL